jgi:hypothetical protein
MHRTTLKRLAVAVFAALATSAALAQTIIVAPPAPRVEVVPPPRAGYVWDPGHWRWDGGRYIWVGGHWQRVRAGYRWVPGHWIQRGPNWRWVPGHWA